MEEKGVSSITVIAIAVVVIAVAVTAVVIYGFYIVGRGAGGGGGGAETSVSDIILHPAQYMGKQVVVRGAVILMSAISPNTGMLTNVGSIYLINLPAGFASIGAMYLVTGIVTTSTGGYLGNTIVISVTDIRLAD